MSAGLVWTAVGVWAGLGAYVTWTDLRRAVIPRRAVWSAGATVAVLLCVAAVAGEVAGGVGSGVVGGDGGGVGSGGGGGGGVGLARFAWAVVGAASVAAVLEAVYRLRPGWVGYGDVRFIVVNALLAGWWGVEWSWWALMAGALAQWPAAAVSLARDGRGAQVRWAPGLTAGTAVVVVWRLWSEGAVP